MCPNYCKPTKNRPTSPERNGRQVIPAEFHKREAPAAPISFAFDRSAKASVPPGIQRRSKVFGLTTGSWAPLSAVAQDQCDARGSSWRSEQDREGDCLKGHGGKQFQHVLAVLICGYRCMKIAPPHPPLPFQLSSPTIPIFKCEAEQAKLQERGCVRIGPDLADWPPFHHQKPCLRLFHPAHTFRVRGERERQQLPIDPFSFHVLAHTRRTTSGRGGRFFCSHPPQQDTGSHGAYRIIAGSREPSGRSACQVRVRIPLDCTPKIWPSQRGSRTGHRRAPAAGRGHSCDSRGPVPPFSQVKVWDVTGVEPIHHGADAQPRPPKILLRFSLLGHSGPVQSVAISHNLQIGVSAADDLVIIVWDLVRGKER